MLARTIQGRASHYDGGGCVTTRYNRSGAVTAVGGCYFVDFAHSQAESTTIETGLDDVTGVTTALIAQAPHLVVADKIIADDAIGDFHEGDGIRCRVLVNSTTDILIGDLLKPVNAQTYLVKATGLTDRWFARALEGRTADTTGAIEVMLYSTGRF